MLAAGNDEIRGSTASGSVADPLSNLRILVVEDSWHLAQALKSLLEVAGPDVIGPAATIAEAHALIAERAPDLALVDVNLHGVMAYSLIDQLIASKIPTVVVTGYEVLPELAAKVAEGKVAAMLSKPIRFSALLTTLRRIAAEPRKP